MVVAAAGRVKLTPPGALATGNKARMSKSDSSEERGPWQYDPKVTIQLSFTKLYPTDGDRGVHDILQCLYRLKPECFQPMGGIHNSADGTETYQSMKIWVTKDYAHTAHIFGTLRGCRFNIERMVVFMKGKQYTMIYRGPDTDSRLNSADKSPWVE